MTGATEPLSLEELRDAFEGAVPAVVATAAADGTPNITYLSRVRIVDAERVALSNQYFSKTARNLAENPRASLLVIDAASYDQYRLTLAYERTDRRGPVFERLREDIEVIAALEGMQGVFKLRAADIYRVVHIEQVLAATHRRGDTFTVETGRRARPPADLRRVNDLASRLARCADLDTLVDAALAGLAELLGYEYSQLLLLDESGTRLFVLASHGYDAEGVGSEVALGDGVVGVAAQRCVPITVGNLVQMSKYVRSVRRSYEDTGEHPGREIPAPGLAAAQSRVAVPAMALGQLVGVLMVESPQQVAFGPEDEAALTVVASIVANAVEAARAAERDEAGAAPATGPAPAVPRSTPAVRVRFFDVDGSTFVDGDYLIKGVAGRLLWALLGHHRRDGRTEFTNREVRLDPALELPEFRDNFENRLILLKRRLDERAAPIRIEKTGRGRFRLVVDRPVELERVANRG